MRRAKLVLRALLFLLAWFLAYSLIGPEVRGTFVDEWAEVNLVEE